jgi:hypothetical protein
MADSMRVHYAMTKARPSWDLLATCVVLVAACTLPGDDTGLQLPPCDCPNLVRVVESIEWVPGVTGRQTDNFGLDDRRGLQYSFDVADPSGEVQRLLGVFRDRGLPVEVYDQRGLPVEADSLIAGFGVSGPSYSVRVTSKDRWLWLDVGLVDSTPDEQADEVLQPVVEAMRQRD